VSSLRQLRSQLLALIFALWFSCMTVECVAADGAADPQRTPLAVHWDPGARDCRAAAPPPLQTFFYDPHTIILRQNPCVSAEANFLYLLIGERRALLIDSGAISDPEKMPLAETVRALLPAANGTRLPLLVVHTHSHLDHRSGDEQFKDRAGVQVVSADLRSVQSFFGFPDWPQGVAHLDLGSRTVDVLPAPGHNDNHVVFYDNATALVFSGDFLMPGRLLISDRRAFADSAARVASYFNSRPVAHVLGAHIELDAAGVPYTFGAHYHPNEHALELPQADLFALPRALAHFNGFYARHPDFVLFNSVLELPVLGVEELMAR
jgi:hydroxyacylglutathione hydrolase